MKPTQIFNVSPSLPERLQPLMDLAYNVRWAWDHDTVDLFRRLDRDLWESSLSNPVRFLGQIKQDRLSAAVEDESIIAHLDRVYESLVDYLGEPKTWYNTEQKPRYPIEAAYFSMEFGLTEALPIYSGGLGILAGDHLKAASDLGLPLTGVGMLYQEGYFNQYLNSDGWQQEKYPDNDFFTMPVKPLPGPDGKPLRISVDMPDGPLVAQLWSVQVGRVTLILLDTNLPDVNRSQDCEISRALYSGDSEMRIKQEILLGIGGIRALVAAGIEPNVFHMNEGHAAFLSLERIKRYMDAKKLDFWEARSVVRASNVFTTHTPVPAGNDVFKKDMVLSYLGNYVKRLGITEDAFIGLGRQDQNDASEDFCMTVLAIKNASFINGVSALHGEVSRGMWRKVWPLVPLGEVPITSVTNGIHTQSWVSKEMTDLLNRYLGPRWMKDPSDKALWDRVDLIPSEELWRTHERRRERLVAFARRRLSDQLRSRGELASKVQHAGEVLNPEALTIGFARRFATYKRGNLLFRNLDRLIKLLSDRDRPIQIIFAGKAHPRDTQGKEVIRSIIQKIKDERYPSIRDHIVFIENYDIYIARYMAQGVDVWLNTPRRPLEASGTSGMKVCPNGAINISILDGWWCEGYQPDNGWAIGHGEVYEDENYQDEIEANSLYDIIEKEVIPLFYDRGNDGLPRRWIERMKNSMKSNCPVFNTSRMVQEYTMRAYEASAKRHDKLTDNDCYETREFTKWKNNLRASWSQVKFTKIDCICSDDFKVGDEIAVTAHVNLAGLTQADVLVQSVHGPLNSDGVIESPVLTALSPDGKTKSGDYIFKGSISCVTSGRYGHTVRIMPINQNLQDPFKMGLIIWGA
ncbi:MAG: alpha-glucan family phosphorylase [bacterium]